MKKNLAVLAVGLILFAGCSNDPDPVSVIEELGQAEAAADVEAIMDLFAEDATFKYGIRSYEYKGKAEIVLFFQGEHMMPIKYEYTDIEAEGNRVTWIIRRGEGQFMSELLGEATVEGGKIVNMLLLDAPR